MSDRVLAAVHHLDRAASELLGAAQDAGNRSVLYAELRASAMAIGTIVRGLNAIKGWLGRG